MTNDSAFQPLINLLAADPRIAAVYLLGSAVSGNMRPDSDIDLALLPERGCRLGSTDLLELASRLAMLAGRPVDLGLLSSKNLVYAREALMTGRRLFCRDDVFTETTAATLLGMYLKFNEDRREVLDAYRA